MTAFMGETMTTGEPTVAQAAELIRSLLDAGTVERLDRVHAALVAAFRAGRAAEQADMQRLADEHAAAFQAAVAGRAAEQAERAERPWLLQ